MVMKMFEPISRAMGVRKGDKAGIGSSLGGNVYAPDILPLRRRRHHPVMTPR
jgi:hypothetical protein